MMRRGVVASVLVVGGCSEGKEGGGLRSVERVEVISSLANGPSPGGQKESLSILSRLLTGRGQQLSEPRRSPALVRLTDGRHAVIGGCAAAGRHLETVEVWDGSAFVVHATAKDTEERSCAAHCTLQDGRSLIVGGWNGLDCLAGTSIVEEGTEGEIQITSTSPFFSRLKNGTATALGDGGALVVGGWDEKRTSRVVASLCPPSFAPDMVGLLPWPLEAHAAVALWRASGDAGEGERERKMALDYRTILMQCSTGGTDGVLVFGGWDGVRLRDEILLLSPSGACRVFGNRMDEETERNDGGGGEGESPSVDSSSRLATPRENAYAVAIGDDLFAVFGGWDGHAALASIEIFRISRNDAGEIDGIEKVPTGEGEGTVTGDSAIGRLVQPRIRPIAFVDL